MRKWIEPKLANNMFALDTDVLTDYLNDRPDYVAKVRAIPEKEICLTVVTVEEVLRGRLNIIRRAEAGKSKNDLASAYDLFGQAVGVLAQFPITRYNQAANELVNQWMTARIRCGTHDLRNGAICIAHDIVLITRNQRDFAKIPDLKFEVW